MKDIDYQKLIKLVSGARPSVKAYTTGNKLVPNVANLGGKVGDIARLDRKGEYQDLSVEILEPARRLLTDAFVIQLLKILQNEDYVTPLSLLSITSLDALWYILHTWFTRNVESYKNQIKTNKKFHQFDTWINTVTHDPLLVRIKVVGIGHNSVTMSSVVPDDWIGKVFVNGRDMQAEMSKLPDRLGKPPVTYAVTYSMVIDPKNTIVKNIKEWKHLFYVDVTKRNVVSELVNDKKPGYQYVKYGDTVIGFKLSDLLEPKVSTGKKDVGVLVSRMQKAIRRGRDGSKVLYDTILALNQSPNYNLPEHSFMRVSASKQLAWRLYISTLEDVMPYSNPELISLQTLILITMICNIVQEYRFTRFVLKRLCLLALAVQYNPKRVNWNNFKATSKLEISDNTFQNSITLATTHLTMMACDREMLLKYYNYEPKPIPIPPYSDLKSLKSANNLITLASYDQHNRTYIILYYQACAKSMTTKEIAKYIWDVSSSYNVRDNKPLVVDKLLLDIQSYMLEDQPNKQFITMPEHKVMDSEMSPIVKRQAFLLLFGIKYRYKRKDVIIGGTVDEPVRIKNDEWENVYSLDLIDAFPDRKRVKLVNPPTGFRWIKPHVEVYTNEGHFVVDHIPIPRFDGSRLLEPSVPLVTKSYKNPIVKKILNAKPIDWNKLLELRYGKIDDYVNWIPDTFDYVLLKTVYTKIQNAMNNIISVGPLTRAGTKMHNAIDYVYEGKTWAVFNLFCYLYPDAIRPHSATNFQVKPNSHGYAHLIHSIMSMLFKPQTIRYKSPVIKTKLWDHQNDSVNKITYGFSQGQFGYGDASKVGAGKTLTALTIASRLMATKDRTYSGCLVLLPGNQLIDTWVTEINEHTEGFDVIVQENNTIDKIKGNTIVISTMARQRDYPTHHNWLLLVIDECLTVQNKNALWTESAWKQSAMSKHLLMMSATFFRTRFDKLYYMLKMLRTGLPETKEYLDIILSECIVSQVSTISLPWTSTFHYFELDAKTRRIYDIISQEDHSVEAMYAKLSSILTKASVAKHLKPLLTRRCLLYARSDTEAEEWSKYLNIPIYPKKGTHCIITLNKGTYGLNDLVEYNTIIMRPPPPDKLPQIKGRLDRPGQKHKQLYIEYFVFKDTIEMGLILRLNIASQFVQKYIMPLATFYDISVNYATQ